PRDPLGMRERVDVLVDQRAELLPHQLAVGGLSGSADAGQPIAVSSSLVSLSFVIAASTSSMIFLLGLALPIDVMLAVELRDVRVGHDDLLDALLRRIALVHGIHTSDALGLELELVDDLLARVQRRALCPATEDEVGHRSPSSRTGCPNPCGAR